MGAVSAHRYFPSPELGVITARTLDPVETLPVVKPRLLGREEWFDLAETWMGYLAHYEINDGDLWAGKVSDWEDIDARVSYIAQEWMAKNPDNTAKQQEFLVDFWQGLKNQRNSYLQEKPLWQRNPVVDDIFGGIPGRFSQVRDSVERRFQAFTDSRKNSEWQIRRSLQTLFQLGGVVAVAAIAGVGFGKYISSMISDLTGVPAGLEEASSDLTVAQFKTMTAGVHGAGDVLSKAELPTWHQTEAYYVPPVLTPDAPTISVDPRISQWQPGEILPGEVALGPDGTNHFIFFDAVWGGKSSSFRLACLGGSEEINYIMDGSTGEAVFVQGETGFLYPVIEVDGVKKLNLNVAYSIADLENYLYSNVEAGNFNLDQLQPALLRVSGGVTGEFYQTTAREWYFDDGVSVQRASGVEFVNAKNGWEVAQARLSGGAVLYRNEYGQLVCISKSANLQLVPGETEGTYRIAGGSVIYESPAGESSWTFRTASKVAGVLAEGQVIYLDRHSQGVPGFQYYLAVHYGGQLSPDQASELAQRLVSGRVDISDRDTVDQLVAEYMNEIAVGQNH